MTLASIGIPHRLKVKLSQAIRGDTGYEIIRIAVSTKRLEKNQSLTATTTFGLCYISELCCFSLTVCVEKARQKKGGQEKENAQTYPAMTMLRSPW